MLKFLSDFPTGVIVRSIGIAPEKALKMVAWDRGMAMVNYAFPNSSKVKQWMFAGSLAGAATTVFGKLHRQLSESKNGQGGSSTMQSKLCILFPYRLSLRTLHGVSTN